MSLPIQMARNIPAITVPMSKRPAVAARTCMTAPAMPVSSTASTHARGFSTHVDDTRWHHARRISLLSGEKADWIETKHRAQGARTCLLEKKSRVVSTMVINDN
jgi:hypothetical protein